MIPLISSGVAGPAGVLHLPRLWQKVVLNAKGQLAQDYPECGGGFDQMVLDALGLDRQNTLDYLHNNVPTYAQFESWVLEQSGGSLDQSVVDQINADIRGYNHDDDTRKSILDLAGLANANTILDAINLNNLEDWAEFHAELTG